jgi:1-acyl-sn-glycerol-3-phosphate acyltransferase
LKPPEGLNGISKTTKNDRSFFYRFAALLIRAIFHINGGIKVYGIENIPMQGGVIIASNHLSYLDPPLISAVIPRRTTFIARKGLFTIPLLGWFIKHFAIPVDRERTSPSTIKEAVKKVNNGELFVIFPEGRRSEDGRLLKGKRGVGMLAGMTGAPVIPTLIVGTDKALPVGGKWLKRSKIYIIFGKSIIFNLETLDRNIYEKISEDIMKSIGELKKTYADICG